MTKKVMISIALASYNGSKYIREQLDSILTQTYQNFELIICDDCSTDNTWQILEEYAEKDCRIKIFRNEKNLGFKKNFEKAISACKGEYVALSDQDDIWTDNHLEILLTNMEDYSVSCGNSLLIDSAGKSMEVNLNENEGLFYLDNTYKYIYRVLLKGNCMQGANMLMHRTFIDKCLPIPDDIPFHDTWFAACACLEKGINYTFEVINKYRQHGNNITYISHNKGKRTLFQKIFSRLKIMQNGISTDRFAYIEELKKRYGLENKEFEIVYNIIIKLKTNKWLSLSDIKTLWDNYYYIQTRKTHRGFIKSLIVWHKWHQNYD